MPEPDDDDNRDDHALMLAVRGGSTDHLALLFRRHHAALFNFFRKLGHGRADAEDLGQETFIRMLRYASSYDPGGSFAAWMYRIARNAAHDAWSRTPPARDDQEPDELESMAAPRQQEPPERYALQEAEQRLERALLRLPRDKRELVLLSRVRLLSMEELAALQDCNVGALKVRLHRALQELRTYFEEETGNAHERQH